MKAIMMLAAVALSIAMTHQAVACDFSREANNAPAVIAEGCSGCATETPTTADATTSTEMTTAKPAAQEPADSAQPQPAPVTVAQQP